MIDWLRRILIGANDPRRSTTYAVNRLRPPGAVNEKQFMALCIRCNRCLEVCPYGSIKREGVSRTMGTPYIFAENKACYLCMACTRLCPTGALQPSMGEPEKAGMGKAFIDKTNCYSHLFLDMDVVPDISGQKIGALCNTCYNLCPLKDTAIVLKKNLFPEITDKCVGCGVCVERCPVRPKRAINIFPTGMGNVDEAGFYYKKAKKMFEPQEKKSDGVMNVDELLEYKQSIGGGERPAVKSPGDLLKQIEGKD